MNYQIQTLNAISPAIYTQLGEHYHVSDHAEQPDAILVRSASMHDLPLAPSVLCIARAGAGTNNIPIDACTQAGVCVLNTPGANANAVCEMVLAAMLLSSIVGTIVPILFKRLGVDPAVASGPLITTVNDLVAVTAYYGLAWGLLINLLHF